MKYLLSDPLQASRFKKRANELFEKKEFVELRRIAQVRTGQQNKYGHLLFTWFAIEYGERVDYVKQHIFKRVVNSDIFRTEYVNPKTGEVREEWRSTADLNTAEMTTCIDRFRTWSSQEASIYLPEANEGEFLKHIEIEAERHKEYL